MIPQRDATTSTRARRRRRSPPRATTSSWPPRSPSPSSVPPRPGPRRSRRLFIEVPVLIGLVYVALAARRFFPQPAPAAGPAAGAESAARVREPEAVRAVRVRPQRRPLADGRRVPHPPRAAPGRGPLCRVRTGQRREPRRRARCRRSASTCPPEHIEGPDQRSRAGVGCGDHHADPSESLVRLRTHAVINSDPGPLFPAGRGIIPVRMRKRPSRLAAADVERCL